MNEPRKILVIRFSSLGDIILTTPLLNILKQNFQAAEIDYCVREEFADAVRNNPNINSILPAPADFTFGELRKLRKQISACGYDIIIDAHNNLRTFYLKLFLRYEARVFVFRKHSFGKFLLVKFKINLLKHLPPIVSRYVKAVESIVKWDKLETLVPEFYTGPDSASKVDKILDELNIPRQGKVICLAPVSKHYTKTYPAELFAELINKFDDAYSIILTGKGDERNNIEKIKSLSGDNVYNLCDKLNITELAELMKRCSLVICGDTGPMHIAEALGIPLVMIAGSSVKEFGFYPQSKNSIVLENNNLTCRPCSHIGRDSCPKVHFKCMREISPSQIFDAAQKLLK